MRRRRAIVLGVLLGLVVGLGVAPDLASAHGPTIAASYSGLRPKQLVVPAGQEVHFRNANGGDLTVTFVGDDGSFESPVLPRGGDWHFSFDTPGVYPYRLKENGALRGTIIVGEPVPAAAEDPHEDHDHD